MDRRSDAECAWLRERKSEVDVEKVSANKIDPTFTLPKIMWLKNNRPSVFRAACTYLQSNGYIVMKLTGKPSMDISHCAMTLLFDIKQQKWSSAVCELAGLDIERLPDVYECTQVVGTVTSEAERQTGLREGTPVVAGCNDGAASSFGTGLIDAGQAYIVMGQAGGAGLCVDSIPDNPVFVNYNYVVEDIWFVLAPMAAFGASFRWASQNLHCDEPGESAEIYRHMNRLVESAPPGSGGVVFLPYMAGERSPVWDTDARGVFFGLHLSTSRADMLRAVMEGTAFSLRHNIELFENSGYRIGDLLCTGGGSKSPLWNQITADILGRRIITVQHEENVTLGNALAAGLGVGIYKRNELKDFFASNVRPDRTYVPDMNNKQLYDALFNIYTSLYIHLREDFQQLRAVVS
jgi:xylulokinase